MNQTTLFAALFALALALASPAALPAAEPATGPVLNDYGPVYPVPDPAHAADPAEGLQAVFDVAKSPDDPAAINPRIETVARYLNLHAGAGFPRNRLRAALVLHGSAAKDSLGHEGYRKRHGVDNPNLELMQQLRKAGVEIYLCGQSAGHRGFGREEIAEPVEVALSAMTVLLQMQAKGYGLIAF